MTASHPALRRAVLAWTLPMLATALVDEASAKGRHMATRAPVSDPVPVAPHHAAPLLALRWAVEGHTEHQMQAALTIRNTGPTPVALSGWAIQFSSIPAILPGEPGDGVEVTTLAGPLVRVRPQVKPGRFLQPGETLSLRLRYHEAVLLPDKAPMAPYLVFDGDSGRGLALADYHADLTAPIVSPETRFARNERLFSVPAAPLAPVFPTPLSSVVHQGKLALTGAFAVEAPPALAGEAALVRALAAQTHESGKIGRAVPVKLALGAVPGQTGAEAYRLEITSTEVTITGTSAAGVYYGVQSLRQIVAQAADKTLPVIDIIDAPRFGYRGLLVDVARNFQSKDHVLAIIDLMARLKLNRLHFHLTDDEGWRLAIPALPELTTVGARRGQDYVAGTMLPPAYGSGPDPADPHGSGFYTAQDYVEILAYARARHIEVIPEVEMPGHARAAVKTMAERARRLRQAGDPHADDWLLADPADRSTYRSAQGYADNVLDPGMPGTYRFVEAVVEELARLHTRAGTPLRQMQIGGDELADGAWEGSPAALRAMAGLPGKSAQVADLWDSFYDRVTAILAARGIRPAGWEELGLRKEHANGTVTRKVSTHFLPQAPTLFVWDNLGSSGDLANRLANAGFAVVLAPATNFYFDMAQERDRAEAGHDWAAYTDLEDVFRVDPLALPGTDAAGMTGLSASGRTHVAGIEATLFSETVRAPWRLGHMLLPRLYGLAERAWAPAPAWAGLSGPAREQAYLADWAAFATQVGTRLLPELDRAQPQLDWRIPPPGLVVRGGQVLANSALPGLTLRYTRDGSRPDARSPKVDGPISLPEGGAAQITVAAFSSTGRSGRPVTITQP